MAPGSEARPVPQPARLSPSFHPHSPARRDAPPRLPLCLRGRPRVLPSSAVDARTQSALLAGIVSLALAVAMLLRQGRTRLWTAFALLNFSLLAYQIGDFLHGVLPASAWPLRITLAAAGLVPAAVLAFLVEFQGETAGRAAGLQRLALVTFGLTFCIAVSPLATVRAARIAAGGAVFLQLTTAVSLLYARMRRAASRTERARLFYLWVGAALCVGLTFGELLIRLAGWPPPPFANVALTIYLYFLAQTLQRHRLLDLNELLGKIVVLASVGLVLVAIYGLLVRWTGGASTGLFLFNTLVASFVILILFEPLKAKVEERVLALFFAERFQLVQALHGLRSRMASVVDVRQLAQVMLDGFYETRRVTHASIYLLADDGLGYRRLDHRGPAPAPYIDAASVRALVQSAQAGQKAQLVELVERRLSELRQLLPDEEETSSVVNTGHLPAEGRGGGADRGAGTPNALAEERARFSEIGAAMAAMRAGVAIPLLAGQRVVGFLCLLDDRVPEAFASDELAAMLAVADQAAITIENSRLYERMKERDRLAALGEMAAGLAHEIRNPLGAIKGAAQYLDPAQFPAGDGEILQIIVEEVNRLDGVVAQFLEYSRPFPGPGAEGKFGLVSLNDVLARTLKLLESQLPKNVRVDLVLTPELPTIAGDAEQLKQVFINLVLNAVQAMEDGGVLAVSTRRPRQPLEMALSDSLPRYAADQVEVRFADTGAGIPDDARDRIFIPFYTTKSKGTGLGLAISQRIIKGHGGTIEVQSRLGEGTEFVLRFPSATALDTAGRLGLMPTPSGGVPPAQQEGQAQADREREEPLLAESASATGSRG
jgi:two-component system, NtrC family, sensor histidine kinase HydH